MTHFHNILEGSSERIQSVFSALEVVEPKGQQTSQGHEAALQQIASITGCKIQCSRGAACNGGKFERAALEIDSKSIQHCLAYNSFLALDNGQFLFFKQYARRCKGNVYSKNKKLRILSMRMRRPWTSLPMITQTLNLTRPTTCIALKKIKN